MFKKLKQKISEEQQQLQQALAPAQASSSSSTPTRTRSRTSSFTDQLDDVTPNRELLAGMVAEPAFLSEYTIFALDSSKQPKTQTGSVNASTQATKSPDGVSKDESSPSQSGDTQTFAQKLQLRVPSMESLFRSPIKESLFRSSKEPLVRTSSRESLNQLDLDCSAAAFDPPSDMESEAEDAPWNSDGLSREQLLQRLRRMERSLSSYRGKYSELVTAFQTLQREKKKLQGILSQSQDKSLRRISELREELQMDQQAKKHLQDEFDACLEEKDQYISVLQTQVSLLKQRLQNGPMNVDAPKPLPPGELQAEVHGDTEKMEGVGEPVGGGTSAKTLEMLQQRVKRQENLLQRCKETIGSHKEQCALLLSEKEALQEQLDERLQELEKMKELHMAEKTKLITQLRDAKNLIEQLEQDKGMVITETKRQMLETLELKEDEIAQLRSHIKQMTTQGEELREQKEKSERAAFEELEKALSTAQKTEDAQRRMKMEMDEQMKAVERASEEERLRLQHELSRVRQEAASMAKKNSEEQVAALQKLHAEELASKEQELSRRLEARERELQEQMRIALEKSRSEYLKLTQEKEQQESLALEELELQKKAILTESENKLQELGQEAEAYRTRILELETSLEKSLQESKTQSEHLAVHLEAEKNKHNKELTALAEQHRTEVEGLQQQQDSLWTERLQSLSQQHQAAVEELREKYQQEKDALLKEKESLFQAHIQDMNEKTLEKLDKKQMELESVSSELSEALRARDQLAEELSVLRGDADKMKQALEAELEEQRRHHQREVGSISEQQELTVRRAEKALKDELSRLGALLDERDEHLRERQARVQDLEAHLQKSAGELQQALAKLDLLHSEQSAAREQAGAYEEQLAQMQQKVLDLETEKSLLTKQVVEMETHKKHVCEELDAQRAQVQQLERQRSELEEKVRSLAQLQDSQLKNSTVEKEQARQSLMEKENIILQMREEQAKEIEILKQTLSSKEESISILHEEYETKFKNQEKRMEKIKQKAKEMQETKKKLLDQEAKLKKELENTVLELSQKEKQFNAQILEMAQANSAGISDTVSRLEENQRQQIESLTGAHQRKLDDVIEAWEKKLSQQAAELRDKHAEQMEEKEQGLGELRQKVRIVQSEKEELTKEVARLKEAVSGQDVALAGLQGQLEQKSAVIVSLSERESQLQSQVEKLEADLGCSLSEKLSLQEELAELKLLADKSQLRVSELTGQVQAAEKELQSCKSLHELSKKSLEDKSLNLKSLLEELASQLDSRCERTKALLEAKTNELVCTSRDKADAILARLSQCQRHTATVGEALLRRMGQVSELEAQLTQLTEEQRTLKSSFQQVTNQLEEKEKQIKTMKADIEGLLTEKEALQQEGGQQRQAASEKESCITQLKKELAENINAVTLLREELSEKKSEIASLSKQLSDLGAQLESSISPSDKAEAISALSKQHEEQELQLQAQLQELSLKVDALSKEKMSALEQVDHWSNKFSEWKKKAQSRLAQHQSTIKDLQAQLDVKATDAREKEEQICLLKEDLDRQNKKFECLKGEMEVRKSKMEKKECDLETALKTQTARVVELEDCVTQRKKEVESLNETLKNYNQQRDTEHSGLVQRLQHLEELGEEKDNKVREAEETVLRLREHVSSLEAELGTVKKELEHVNSSVKSRDGELKALEDKLELESAAKVELKRKAEQKIAAIRKQLLSQMEEKTQRYAKDTENRLSELSAQLKEREKQVHSLEDKLKNLESSPHPEVPAVSRSMQSVAASPEQEAPDSQDCTHKACKERLCMLQRRLSEKEKLLRRLEQGEGEARPSQPEAQHRALSGKLDCTRARQLEDHVLIGCLPEELEEKMKCSLIVSQPMGEETGNNTGVKQNWASVVDSVQKTLQEKELTCQALEQRVKELESDLVRERGAHRLEVEKLTLKYEKSQSSQQEMDGENKCVEVLEDRPEENSQSHEIQSNVGTVDGLRSDLESKLTGAERDKQKLSKEVARLQKELRALRREHQQELDILKRECEQEAEEKLKQEQEDLELKHTSTLKQLMREFNTQLAQKEQELERTVQETIDKAQEVEAELLESHQEETQQLHRKIAEKEDDLRRTARRYEEILDAREEEMTGKVTDLQTQLEELQKKYQQRLEQEESTKDSVTILELQTQLAQKTTLISDSKLKEQELREQVHNLEDRLKRYEKNACAATVGTPYKGGNLYHTEVSLFGEPTEFEYLRKVMFEYMMGRETKTMAKVITTVLKFPDDQAQKILEREDARLMSWLRTSS
ncbi:golgin subfamily A member 4 isoform 2 [Mus musculus]|uniref:golgin subfamily A member 4 isoform 2 n=1 Tax=Mus musculus TaxID=10090 RepID=UPI0003D76CD3|nr:golgin subfamily A member 4 isoform 2 [Mus musculus]|eukprot:XP_006512252.1 PREDICTED: golgin subfamily A member 4 isoform X3 [Mus musculus]